VIRFIDSANETNRQNTGAHSEKGPCAAGGTFRRLIAKTEEQRQVNDETVTTVEKEIRSLFGVLRAFVQNENADRSDRLKMLPFPI